ncbi:uncharacterized protein LOC131672131 isoform X2 [Phymastichus coffea]|uniref:uncharacterized protein LOC131672131 isoform X2 n=2 Tax=Phymastichus coffea TaxID=108790 RepID=UPI00273B5095|nr:uncharacterized protein LOC131672131 isoform X2 [Phymastichus coffea]
MCSRAEGRRGSAVGIKCWLYSWPLATHDEEVSMDFMVRRLIRMSMTFRNLAFAQVQRVILPRLFNTSGFHKDRVSGYYDLKSPKEDLLLKTLQQGLCPSKLLNYIDSNKHHIKQEHVIAALSSLHNFYENKCRSPEKVHEQIDFTKLYMCFKPQIRQLTSSDVIEALKILQFLNVPSSNIFFVTLLQQIQESIRELSFQEICTLSDLLTKCTVTDLSQSIMREMTDYFLTKISQLDKSDISNLIYALSFASKNIQDTVMLNFLLDSITHCKRRLECKEAYNTLCSLCDVQELPYSFTNLIQRLQEDLIDNIDKLQPDQILYMVKVVSIKINTGCEEFYNEIFIDELIDKIIYENCNFYQVIDVLSHLNSIQHAQMDLLDYISALCYEDPNILNLDLNSLQPIVTGLALADYKPVFWDIMKENILNNVISKAENLQMCYFALHLACLECFNNTLLQEVFSMNNLYSKDHTKILLQLYQMVKVLYPSYKGPWPSKDVLVAFKTVQHNDNKDYPLLSALEQAVGGNAYIKTNVRTTLEHCIDHMVIMNKSGCPIAINSYETITNKISDNDIIYLEDLTIPPGSQIFLILNARPEWYTRNTQRILGPYSLFIKTLESMSYRVIPVDCKMWNKLPENEKTSYLVQAIKLKFKDD